MAGITQAQAQEHLDYWLAADIAVSSGQSYTYSSGGTSRSLTKADGDLISRNIDKWDARVKKLSRGGRRVRGVTPV